jgi:hypothetical protein
MIQDNISSIAASRGFSMACRFSRQVPGRKIEDDPSLLEAHNQFEMGHRILLLWAIIWLAGLTVPVIFI